MMRYHSRSIMIKCLQHLKSLGSLFEGVLLMSLSLSYMSNGHFKQRPLERLRPHIVSSRRRRRWATGIWLHMHSTILGRIHLAVQMYKNMVMTSDIIQTHKYRCKLHQLSRRQRTSQSGSNILGLSCGQKKQVLAE